MTSNDPDDPLKKIFSKLEEIENSLSGIKTDLKTLSNKVDKQQDIIELIGDRMTMLDTQISSIGANAQYSPYRPIPIGPTGHALSETRSRWKRGWFHSL